MLRRVFSLVLFALVFALPLAAQTDANYVYHSTEVAASGGGNALNIGSARLQRLVLVISVPHAAGYVFAEQWNGSAYEVVGQCVLSASSGWTVSRPIDICTLVDFGAGGVSNGPWRLNSYGLSGSSGINVRIYAKTY